jgi:tetratricopeptide (TPR) repeat protein
MIRLCFIAIAAAFVMGSAPAAQAQDTLHDYWRRMGEAHQAQDWDGVILNGRLARADKNWDRLPASARWPILTREGEAHLRLGQYEAARRRLAQALRITPEQDRAVPLFYLFHAELGREAWIAASAILMELQRIEPAQIDDFSLAAMNRVIMGLERDGETDSYAALIPLLATEYQPSEPGAHLDWIYLRHAGLLAASGQREAAMMQLEPVLESDARIEARSSLEFAPLWSDPRFDRLTDPVAGEEASLARAITDAQNHPQRLAPRRAQVRSLMRLGRVDEAAALAEALLADLEDGEPYRDADEVAPWLMNDLARLFYVENRAREADALMARSAALVVQGRPRITQVISFATLLTYQSRHAEALAILARMENASGFDSMEARSAAACSHHHLGRPQERDQHLALLEADWADNPAAYQRALICVGDFDRAASLIVRRLNAPRHRPAALRALQERRLLANAEIMPLATQLEADFAALKDRSDVQAAIAQAGRVERIDLYQPVLETF